ncbi:MAG: hypothetical protein JJT82_02215 [Legionellaceae bacterium]|nr:hypothetical protein [Legionellaceae bacterium]
MADEKFENSPLSEGLSPMDDTPESGALSPKSPTSTQPEPAPQQDAPEANPQPEPAPESSPEPEASPAPGQKSKVEEFLKLIFQEEQQKQAEDFVKFLLELNAQISALISEKLQSGQAQPTDAAQAGASGVAQEAGDAGVNMAQSADATADEPSPPPTPNEAVEQEEQLSALPDSAQAASAALDPQQDATAPDTKPEADATAADVADTRPPSP